MYKMQRELSMEFSKIYLNTEKYNEIMECIKIDFSLWANISSLVDLFFVYFLDWNKQIIYVMWVTIEPNSKKAAIAVGCYDGWKTRCSICKSAEIVIRVTVNYFDICRRKISEGIILLQENCVAMIIIYSVI